MNDTLKPIFAGMEPPYSPNPEPITEGADTAQDKPTGHEAVIAALAKLSPIEYDRIRVNAAAKLRIQVKTLDAEVKAIRAKFDTPSTLPFQEVEPCETPIEPAIVLNSIVAAIRRYLIMELEQADAMALWVMHSWVIDALEVSPLLIVTAPERACGKTQTLTVCSHMVARPLSAANSTSSFLFRAIDLWKATLLIDEVDTFMKHNDDMKGIINAGHTRSSAFIGRTVAVGDTHEPRIFPVWGAKALAGIALEKHLPDSTMSRGIVLNLRRKLPHEKVERLRHANRDVFESLRPQLARFALDYGEEVRSAKPHLPDQLSDRAQDNWEPLLAIASCAGPEWFDRATQAALKLSHEADSLTNTGNELLADVQEIFEAKNKDKITTSELIAALIDDEEKSWATYNRGRPLSPRQLANMLKPYNIQPRTVRVLNTTPKGYYRIDFEDAFSRYLTRELDPK
ncbi:MAG: DUF3631 domain-containing protein [Gammaproteobacteria bacterium]|nr:DUF3631 domain-containing protein [Gammaproteobacteria bacterium]